MSLDRHQTPDTSAHCETMDMGLVHLAVCLFTSQLWLVLTASTHERMARLSQSENMQEI